MPRLPDWTERLAEAIEVHRHTPFAWGTQDCCMFAADVALAITGRDPAEHWRGSYSTEEEAAAFLADGLEAVVDGALMLFGSQEIPPAMASRGDWALVANGNELVVGVVLSGMIAVPGPDGLGFLRADRALRAWRI